LIILSITSALGTVAIGQALGDRSQQQAGVGLAVVEDPDPETGSRDGPFGADDGRHEDRPAWVVDVDGHGSAPSILLIR